MRKLFYINAIFLLGLPLLLSAQPRFEAGAMLGLANYQGDLVEETVPLFKEGSLGGGIMGRYVFTYALAVRANLMLGKITGDDYNYDNEFRRRRGAQFSSSIFELSVVGEWEPLGQWRYLSRGAGFKKLISPYVFAGLGFTFTNPKTDFSRADFDDVKLAAMIERDQNARYFKTRISTPIGFGVKFDLSEYWVAGVEFGMRYPFTDYLDGVSLSGNPDKKDWYQFSGITLCKRFRD
jgi:hypothetical protein